MDSFNSLKRGGRRLRIRRMLLTLILIVLIGAPLLFLAVRRFETAIIFHPEKYREGATWRLPRGGEEVWFETRTGARLHGWFVRSQTGEAVATVLYFHGNGGNLSYTGWLGEELSSRGFDVLLFDYKGYGRSEGASTGEASLYEDADAAYDYLVRTRGVAPERIALYGQSLGTAAAADLASRRTCAALILESGLSSAREMAALVFPVGSGVLHRAARNRFETTRKLAQINRPVLVAHGERDEVIPARQGRALYEAAREPKRLIVLPDAGHNDLVALGGDVYLDEIASFIKTSLPAVEDNNAK